MDTATTHAFGLNISADQDHLGLKIANAIPLTWRSFRSAVLHLTASIEDRSEGFGWAVCHSFGDAWGGKNQTARIWIELGEQSEADEAREVLGAFVNA